MAAYIVPIVMSLVNSGYWLAIMLLGLFSFAFVLLGIVLLGASGWIILNRQNFLPLMRREFSAYFMSPIAYLVLLGFLVVATYNYWDLLTLLNILAVRRMDFSGLQDPMLKFVCHNIWFWFSIVACVPIITMRLLAEERKSGTIEVLMTAPVTESQVVISKFAGCMCFYTILWIPSLVLIFALDMTEDVSLAWGPVLAVFLGIFTIGCMFVSIGLFFSSLTKDQITSAILTFAFMLLIFGIFMMHGYVEAQGGDETWLPVLKFVAVFMHLRDMGMGAIDVRHLVFHLSVTAFMLFLAVKMVEARKWK